MNTMKFPPGKSGNPAGRPPGSRHKTTKMAQALFDEIGQVIVENRTVGSIRQNPCGIVRRQVQRARFVEICAVLGFAPERFLGGHRGAG